ncbi:MAG: AbrB/MazE/SpoVT family DNA-binding domain-containing protein [Burkholderiales bacterium]|nr:AbrB/MazE/SpoVT family DNA-binding domain-containing protein [Burkholderiales bacterium]
MLAKLTAKNQLTLPKAAIEGVGATEYFEVEVRAGQIVLTPVRLQRADAVRAKLAALGIKETDIAAAVAWARKGGPTAPAFAAQEPAATYGATRPDASAVAASDSGGKRPTARSRTARLKRSR